MANPRVGGGAPLQPQIFSILCSFLENLAKSYNGAPWGDWYSLLQGILDPPLLNSCSLFKRENHNRRNGQDQFYCSGTKNLRYLHLSRNIWTPISFRKRDITSNDRSFGCAIISVADLHSKILQYSGRFG